MKATLASSLITFVPTIALADCTAQVELVREALNSATYDLVDGGKFSELDGSCVLSGVRFEDRALVIELGQVSWSLDGVEGLATESGTVSLAANIEMARFYAKASDPWISYMLERQSARNFIEAKFDGSWDLDDGRLTVERFHVDLPGDNSLTLAFSTHGIMPALISGEVAELATLELGEMNVAIRNHGFADGPVLSMLIASMSGIPGDPETVIEATRREASERIAQLPEAVFPESTKNALAMLVRDAPVPWGEVTIRVRSDPPLSIARLIPLGLSSDPLQREPLAVALEGATVDVSYVPGTGAE